MSDYRLSDLLDLTIVQKMAEAHYRAAGMPVGIIDAIDGSILVGTGWQDLCVKFHRANPVSLQRCRESDNYIKDHLIVGDVCRYKCQNGLWDIGLPIVVAGRNVATMFLGQFFYEGEAPDRDFFIQLAHEFGFDVDDYLAALEGVPVFSREKVDYILEYDKALVSFIADLAGHSLLKTKADEEIKRQAEFLQLLIDAMPYPVFYKDRQGRYLSCNSAFERFYGKRRAQIAGKTVYEVAPKELADVYRQADDELFAHPGTQMYEGCVQTTDGVQHNVIFHKATFEGPRGTLAGIIGAVDDITERKKTEEEIKRLNDNLLARNEQLEFANKELESFIYSVSHDLRGPLRAISGFSEIIMKDVADKLDEKGKRYIASIHDGTEKMSRLIDDLLNLSRISRQEIQRREVNVSAIAASIINELREAHPGTSVEVDIKEGLIAVADPGLIEVVLSNLLGNAWKFTAKTEQARIEFGTVEQDGKISYYVRDNGAGFNQKYAGKMFWPFHRLHSEAEFEGTGIGLAIVDRIISRHGGKVWAEGIEGKGATIYFALT